MNNQLISFALMGNTLPLAPQEPETTLATIEMPTAYMRNCDALLLQAEQLGQDAGDLFVHVSELEELIRTCWRTMSPEQQARVIAKHGLPPT